MKHGEQNFETSGFITASSVPPWYYPGFLDLIDSDVCIRNTAGFKKPFSLRFRTSYTG